MTSGDFLDFLNRVYVSDSDSNGIFYNTILLLPARCRDVFHFI